MGKLKKRLNNDEPRQIQGIPFKTDRGQHILKNPGVINAIVEKSAVKSTDIVMEVGSGTGNLSMKLLERSKKLIAFEIDSRMVAELKKRVIDTPVQYKLQVIECDVIKQEKWPPFDVCVTNLPFQISSPFLSRLLQHRPLPRYAVIMLQKEFADRLIAKPGTKAYCRLSVNTQLLAKTEHLMKVKRTEFRPPPKVDSAVVRIEPRNPPPPINYNEWDGLLRIAFIRKNKTLHSVFRNKQVTERVKRNYLKICDAKNTPPECENSLRDKINEVLTSSGFADRRARNMSVEDFLSLLLAFNKAGIYFS